MVDEQRAHLQAASKLEPGSAEMRQQFEQWLDSFEEAAEPETNLSPDQWDKEIEAYWARQRAHAEEVS